MTANDRNALLMDLFARAVALGRDERQTLILRECADDPKLGAELTALLEVQGRGLGGFLTQPAIVVPLPGFADRASHGEPGQLLPP